MKARINKQYEIEELVKMLGKILRSSIPAGTKDMTIAEEVELVECYLKIQQYRFGERIQYQIYMEEGIREQKSLPLLTIRISQASRRFRRRGRSGCGCPSPLRQTMTVPTR